MPPPGSTALSGRGRCSSRLSSCSAGPTTSRPLPLDQMHAQIPTSPLILFEGAHLFTFTTWREERSDLMQGLIEDG
jgi:hypothetical protein